MKKQTRQEKIIDRRIEQAYYATCKGIAINVMDIGKVFDYGRCVETGITDMELQDKIYHFVLDLNSKA